MAATARTIPKANLSVPKTDANLAGFGFGAMYPSWLQICRIFRGIIGGRSVNYFTLRISVILMETIKDLYRDLGPPTPAPNLTETPVCLKKPPFYAGLNQAAEQRYSAVSACPKAASLARGRLTISDKPPSDRTTRHMPA
jgi:hypothetical protein